MMSDDPKREVADYTCDLLNQLLPHGNRLEWVLKDHPEGGFYVHGAGGFIGYMGSMSLKTSVDEIERDVDRLIREHKDFLFTRLQANS